MRKLLLLLFIVLFMFGCVSKSQITKEEEVIYAIPNVNLKVRNSYLSSVVIKDRNDKKFGSGVIIYNKKDHSIVVLTVSHIVENLIKNDKDIYISSSYGERYESEILKVDEKFDLALLYTEKKAKNDGPYAKLSTINPAIGDNVWVVSCLLDEDHIITNGIISNFSLAEKEILYRSTAPIMYGSSGGGMYNDRGELIGIARYISFTRIGLFSMQIKPAGFYFSSLDSIREFLGIDKKIIKTL